jgi:hypothetical protein
MILNNFTARRFKLPKDGANGKDGDEGGDTLCSLFFGLRPSSKRVLNHSVPEVASTSVLNKRRQKPNLLTPLVEPLSELYRFSI